MSIYGEWLTATIAVDGTLSSAVNLGKDYEHINVDIPTVVSGTLQITVCRTVDGTYKDLGASVKTGVTTGNYNDTWILGGWQFIKIESSATQTTTERVFYVRGYRS